MDILWEGNLALTLTHLFSHEFDIFPQESENAKLCVRLFVCLFAWLLVCSFVCLFVWLFGCLVVCLFVCLFVHAKQRIMRETLDFEWISADFRTASPPNWVFSQGGGAPCEKKSASVHSVPGGSLPLAKRWDRLTT